MPAECKKENWDVRSTYPFNKLHDDRVHGTFDMMLMIGGEGPVVWTVFDLGF